MDEPLLTVRDNSEDYNTTLRTFKAKENSEIERDSEFWKIVKNIASVYQNHNRNDLSEYVDANRQKKIKGLYRALEMAALDFIRNSAYQSSEDGYGSDSDCEVCIKNNSIPGTKNENIVFYSRKIIVSTGMRAINLAHFLSIYISGTIEADTEIMYYETHEALEKGKIKDILKSLDLKRSKCKQEKIKYIDLTHCDCDGPRLKVQKFFQQKLITGCEDVIVLDYTSATSQIISKKIKQYIQKVPVLLLVNSGLKNEQNGADMNPYGTIRIVAKDAKKLNELYCFLKASLVEKEKLPKELHNIRKAYKDAGAVLKNKAIYTESRGYSTSSCHNVEDNDDINKEKLNRFKKVKKLTELLFSGDYKDQLKLIINIHEQNISEVIHDWELDKIEILSSEKVLSIVRKGSNDTFRQIKYLFDENTELTKRMLNDINDSNIHVFANVKFCDLFSKIKEDVAFDHNENVIDKILQKNVIKEISSVVNETFEQHLPYISHIFQ